MAKKYKVATPDYIRVGVDYFKLIQKPDRFGVVRQELKKWKKEEIKQDHQATDKYYLDKVPKFDDFIIEPDNNGIATVIGSMYNMYSKFPHAPSPGKWKWTEILLRHIFGNQYELGIKYLQAMYLHPKQALPVLALVSEERQTGKSTFLDWLNLLFGANVAMIEPDVIGSSFNSEYATSNIICIDETILDKQIAVEKIKSLATKKFISVNIKNVSQFKVPFFGKIVLASNNEDKFMRIDDKEIRFWIRKIPAPTIENHNILTDMVDEIPSFIDYLKHQPAIDFTRSRMVFTAEEIANTSLDAVKKESRSGLHKELEILITDWFYNNNYNDFMATPTDIKNKWFINNNQISTHYISRVLRDEMAIKMTEKVITYNIFSKTETWVGKPFVFQRIDFKINKVEDEETVPF